MTTKELEAVYGPVISSYSRAEAIEDGVLVDVSGMAKEAGFVWPVVVTRRVWEEVVVPDDRSRPYGQSEEGRLWDVLYMLKIRIQSNRVGGVLFYKVLTIAKARQKRLYTLKAVVDGGDDGEPVISIMFPEED